MKRIILRRLRENIGNRPEVATKLGISIIHLRKLENGDVKPSSQLMLKICTFFQKTPEELFPDILNDAVKAV